MLTFYNSQNQPVKLLKTLGKGGEGTVYTCEDEMLVGKIYHEPPSGEKAEKLRWMAAHGNEQLLKTTAWVAEILTDKPDGKVVGFLMPKIKAKEIHELYSPKSRRVHFPDATWHFLVHTATNLARAFHNLHRDNHVMGDVNQGNCVVTADGTVKLIDCDSYEITTSEKIYPCEVGVTTHIPPELQGKNLRGVDRSDNHDNFGLAVIIFQLLFLGRHPFAGNYLGAEDKTIEDAIREHLFVYGADAEKKRVVQPPGTPALNSASLAIAELFERAFAEENNRPKPHEWVQSLEHLADNLQQCLLNPGHVFYTKLALCPWCEIEENTGLILFPFTVSSNALSKKYERDFNVSTIEKLIESFNVSSLQKNISTLFDVPEVEPSPAVIAERRQLNKMILISLGISLIYLIFSFLFGFGVTFYFGFFAILLFQSFKNGNSDKEFRQNERDKLAELQAERDYLKSTFLKDFKIVELNRKQRQIDKALDGYENLRSEKTREDIEDSSLKENLENRIHKAENKITELLIGLRSASVEVHRQQRKFFAQAKESSLKFAQAQANVKHLGYELPVAVSILVGAIAFSIFMPKYDDLYPKPVPASASKNIVVNTSAPKSFDPPPAAVSIPPETITDKEIAALDNVKRNQIASELIKKAYPTLDTEKNEEAQKSLKFALRFDKNNVETMSLLGRALYNSKKYKDALKQFESAMKIDAQKTDRFYFGMTYLQLKKYEEARDIFHKLTSESMSAAGLYNLGSAYMGLKDYEIASKTYGMALKINPGDADSLYQLGICFSKMNDVAGVKDTYATLKALNSPLAEDLRKEVGKKINLDEPPVIKSTERGTGNGAGSGRGTYEDAEPPPPLIKRN